MKKVIVGLAAVGAVLALRPVLKHRMVQKMHKHCKQMGPKCKQMMAAQSTGHGEPADTRELPEPEAPHFVANGEAVAV
jgi:hypothetical protein